MGEVDRVDCCCDDMGEEVVWGGVVWVVVAWGEEVVWGVVDCCMVVVVVVDCMVVVVVIDCMVVVVVID